MSRALRGVIEFLRRAVPATDEPTDRELLRRFATAADQDAFARLVERHGPMVQSVCERVIGNGPDTDDAFQATFLVLARKAAALGWHESIAAWLHEVAYRVGSRQRSAAACRRFHERQAPAMTAADLPDPVTLKELRTALDRELARLPEKYRAPLVLCYLEGKTNEEAATLLGWTKGTVSGRLARARELLRGRLGRQGICLSAAAFATALGQQTASASVAPLLVSAAIQAVHATAPAAVVNLAQGVIHAMFWNHVRILAIRLAIAFGLATGIGVVAYQTLAREAAPASRERVENPNEVALAPLPAEGKVDAEAAKAIKALLPEAASSPNEDWRKLGQLPTLDNIKSHSLSLVLMTLHAGNDPALAKELRLLNEPVNPAKLVQAISRSQAKGYGTFLQPEFITDVTCRVKDNEATGIVSFRADKLYEGRAQFTARKTKDGRWRVEEFRMPAYNVRVTLQADGTWKRTELAAHNFVIKDAVTGITIRASDDRKSLIATKEATGEIVWKAQVVPPGNDSVIQNLHRHEGEVWVGCSADKTQKGGEPFHKYDIRSGKLLHTQVDFPK